jgi:hypothetical protein
MIKALRSILLLGLFLGACITIEFISYRRLIPAGRAMTLTQFLQWQTGAQRFGRTAIAGEAYVIAYGPASSSLLLSSGPSAYVYDSSGRLVDWSADIGDDPTFGSRWNDQRAMKNSLSRSAVALIATTQP